VAEGDGLSGMPPDRDGLRRVLLVASVIVALAAASVVGAWALFFRDDVDTPADADTPSYEHAQATAPETSTQQSGSVASGSVDVSASASVTEPGAPEGGTESSVVVPPASQPVVGRRAYVAYRLNDNIVVAGEDGSSPKVVAKSPSGVFALSPDARSLAYVDYSAGKLVLADTTSTRIVTVGPAAQVTPVWSPDSKTVFYVRDAKEHRQDVWQVARTGKGAARMGSGSRPAVSPDGSVVALAAGATTSSGPTELPLLRGGKPWRTLKAPGSVTDVVLASDRAFVAVAPGEDPDSGEQVEGIWALPFDTAVRPVRLVAPGAIADRASFGMLSLSPDGQRLAYVRAGDDGYARMSVVKTAGGEPYAVSTRRDCYPVGWTTDSSAIFFIEGNGWQGEPTALVRLKASGSGRTVIVSGASL